MSTVVILQPSYLPWLGFFDQMKRADHFVLYDDVQYDKHGWRNRNRIKMDGRAHWVTVPVLHRGRAHQLIRDVEIDHARTWWKKQLKSLRQCYAKSHGIDYYYPKLESVLTVRWRYLIDLNSALIDLIREWLNIDTPIYRSSELGIKGARTERLISICKAFNATHYLSGDAAKVYLKEAAFEAFGIQVSWHHYEHPIYPQQGAHFVPYLSVIDLLMNVGDKAQAHFECVSSVEKPERSLRGA